MRTIHLLRFIKSLYLILKWNQISQDGIKAGSINPPTNNTVRLPLRESTFFASSKIDRTSALPADDALNSLIMEFVERAMILASVVFPGCLERLGTITHPQLWLTRAWGAPLNFNH